MYRARMVENRPDSWCFLVVNIGTLPNERSFHGKINLEKWKNWVTQDISSINIISELNKEVGMLPRSETLKSLTQGWWNGMMCRLAFLRETVRTMHT